MYAYTSADSSGLPHSSHSVTVSGSDGSRIEFSGVHERHLRHDAGERVRGQVRHRAHQQPAGRAAPGHQPVRRRPAGLDQVPGARHEVGEGVLLGQQLALVVPAPAQLAAAAHVRHREDDATVQQGQPRDGEPRVDAGLVRAVAVEHARGRAVARGAGPAHQRDRHPGAVVGAIAHSRCCSYCAGSNAAAAPASACAAPARRVARS